MSDLNGSARDWRAERDRREARQAISDPVKIESAMPRRYSGPERAAWLKGCICDERGRVIANVANVMLALREAPDLLDVFAFDEMLAAPILMKDLPLAPGAEPPGGAPPPRPVRDEDVSQLQEWLQHAGMPKVAKETTHQAVDQRARERAFHPVQQWLKSLRWDELLA